MPTSDRTAALRPSSGSVESRFPKAWTSLSTEIERCTLCPLHRTRTHVVVYRGPPHPRVVFVGEAPGAEEDRAGIPFVGRSGQRLDQAIERVGLVRSEVGVLNLIKCRPPNNRFDRAASRTCRPYLDRQLALLRPSVVVTLGAHALAAFDPDALPITRAAGTAHRWGSTHLFPLLHPAAPLHAHRYQVRWDHDLDRLARQLERWAA